MSLSDADGSAAVAPHQLPVTTGSRLEAPDIRCQWMCTHELQGWNHFSLSSSGAPPTQFYSNTENVHLVFAGNKHLMIAFH